MIRNTLLTFVLIASCFIVSFSYGQQKKIIGQPFSAAYEYASNIAKAMHFTLGDSTEFINTRWSLRMGMMFPGDSSKWAIIEFNKDHDIKIKTIESVSISGSTEDIIELYATLYDPKVRKVKPEDVYTSIDKDGEIKVVRTDHLSNYAMFPGLCGRLYIRKSERTK